MAGAADPWTSVTNATHLVLDGVPMRIAENFRPKQRKQKLLPKGLRFDPAQSEALNFTNYEFKTEHGFIKWHKDAERERKERMERQIKVEKEKRRQQEIDEQLRKQQELEKREQLKEKTTAQVGAESKSSAETANETAIPVKAAKPVAVPATVMDGILLPQRVSPVTVLSTDQPKSTPGVNIKDFENAEDPFDNLELKSINDMQELESVLAKSQVQQATGQVTEATAADTSSAAEARASPIYQNPHAETRDSPIYQNPHAETQDSLIYQNPHAETRNSPIYQNPHAETQNSPVYENPQAVLCDESNIYSNATKGQFHTSGHLNDLNRKKTPLAAPRQQAAPVSQPANNLDKSPLLSAQFSAKSNTVNIVSNSESKPGETTRQNIQISSKKPPPPVRPPPPVKPKPTVESKESNIKPGTNPVASNTKDTKVQSLANVLNKELGSMSRPPGAPKGFSYTAAPVANGAQHEESEDKGVKDIEWPSIESRSLPSTPTVDEIAPPLYPRVNRDSYHATVSSSDPQQISKVKEHKAADHSSATPLPGLPQLRKKPKSVAASKTSNITKTRKSSRSSADGQAIESLLSMGFEKAQISAAMKHIGSDTKQLAEHLCAVQQLVNQNVKWQSAQQAVFMCGPDLARAEKFAKAYQQLSEFGFGDDKVKEALISSDMDMQKALDSLVQ